MLTIRQLGESAQPVPVWLAALFAARCQVTNGNDCEVVPWSCISGRAVYTNDGAAAQWIEPLGVSLQRGETLAVSWRPGDTAYTLKVCGHAQMCASELRIGPSRPRRQPNVSIQRHSGRQVS